MKSILAFEYIAIASDLPETGVTQFSIVDSKELETVVFYMGRHYCVQSSFSQYS